MASGCDLKYWIIARPFLSWEICSSLVSALFVSKHWGWNDATTNLNMRLYQTTRLKHICIGNVTVSSVKESNKTASVVGLRCLLGLRFSCTGVFGPCYLQKVKPNIWNRCKPLVNTPNTAFNTYRKHFNRAFASTYTYEDAFGLARDKPEKFWSEAAEGITWFEPWTQTLDKTDTVFPKWQVQLIHYGALTYRLLQSTVTVNAGVSGWF